MDKYSSFSCTCVGASHLARKLICQDYSFESNNDSFVFAATADGHGSLQYLRTEKGSEFAVKAAYDCTEGFISSLEGAEDVLADETRRLSLFEQLCTILSAAERNDTDDHTRKFTRRAEPHPESSATGKLYLNGS